MKTVRFLAVAALAATAVAQAQTPPSKGAATTDMPGMSTPKMSSAAAAAMSEGEVLKVMPQGVLLKHGPIQNIGMDAMTMQFNVTDAKLLKSIKKGDKVRFVANYVNGQFLITDIKRLK